MVFKLIAIAGINLLIAAHAAKQYVATFSADNSGVAGTVTSDNGKLVLSLDLSGIKDSAAVPKNYSYCASGGLKYHIHTQWTHPNSTDRIGSTPCSGTYTASHWDPWAACGSASGNPYCGDGTGTTCVNESKYSPDFDANPFSAEVGDWSSKYGLAMPDATTNMISRTDTSFYEVLPTELEGQSIVFHCGTPAGERVFCAPFLPTVIDASATVPSQDATKSVVAKFTTLSDESMIILMPDGSIKVDIDATAGEGPDAVTKAGCSEFEYSIFEKGGLNSAATGEDCLAIGAQYDPTAQCLPWSGNSYCTNGKLCNDQGYSYNCAFSTARYSCAPGDLSGKMGELITTSAAYSKSMDGPRTLIPPTDSLIGKVIAINCPYSVSTTRKYLACAPIEEYTTSTPTTTGDCSVISFFTAIIVSFIASLY